MTKLHSNDDYAVIVLNVLAMVSKMSPDASKKNLLCSFEWRIHPDCQDIKEKLDAWVQMHLSDSDNTIIGYEKLLKSDLHLLISMVFASARIELMPSLMKQMVWLFVLDNYLDDPHQRGADIKTLEEMMVSLMDVFCVDDTTRSQH